MTEQDLERKLQRHAVWLRGESSGEKLVLRRTSLRRTSLRGVDLIGADLRRADLRGADLHEIDLRGADLHEIDLRGAELDHANLRGAVGFRPLYHTTHGYLVHAVECESGWRISAGCRRQLTIEQARAHWGNPGYPDAYDQRMILAALDAFEAWLAQPGEGEVRP